MGRAIGYIACAALLGGVFFLNSASAENTQRVVEVDRGLRFHEIVRLPDGRVRYMNFGEATAYCKCENEYDRRRSGCTTEPDSARLPSVRELAAWATFVGARGIAETCFDNYYCSSISVRNADNTSDLFYFDYRGFLGGGGNHYLWSSSFSPISDFDVMVLSNESGVFGFRNVYSVSAVRCISNR